MAAAEIDPRIKRTIASLLNLTRTGRATWERFGTRRVDAFSYDATQASVVMMTKDQDGVAPFIFQIRNSEGQVVERFTTESLDVNDAEDAALFEEVELLYGVARRSALRTDQVLDSLVMDLEREGNT